MKRLYDESSSDSELDEMIDVGKEEHYCPVTQSTSPTTTSHILARKRRRGIIEKRRRDRINNSLSELRRLVPTAFEKQGSSKLEKAEILQMTVDHLKLLHATGGKDITGYPLLGSKMKVTQVMAKSALQKSLDLFHAASFSISSEQHHFTAKGYFDPHLLAVDYRSMGFRECLAEVIRYLSSLERFQGHDNTDPLKERLVSHLNNYVSEIEPTPLAPASLIHRTWTWPHHQLTTLLPQTAEGGQLPCMDTLQNPAFLTGSALACSTSSLRGIPLDKIASSVISPTHNLLPNMTSSSLNFLSNLASPIHRVLSNMTCTFPGVLSNVSSTNKMLTGVAVSPQISSPLLSPASSTSTIHTTNPTAAIPGSLGLFPSVSHFRHNPSSQTSNLNARKSQRSWTTAIGAF